MKKKIEKENFSSIVDSSYDRNAGSRLLRRKR